MAGEPRQCLISGGSVGRHERRCPEMNTIVISNEVESTCLCTPPQHQILAQDLGVSRWSKARSGR
jgi:hypothetical protein